MIASASTIYCAAGPHPGVTDMLRGLFPQLPETAREAIAVKWIYIRELNRGDRVVDRTIWFVESGSLKVATERRDREQIVDFGYPGKCFANLIHILADESRGFYVEALRKTKLVGLRYVDFLELCEQFPELKAHWDENLRNNLLEFVERDVELAGGSPQEQFEWLLEKQPDWIRFIPKRHLATYLNLSPETLSRFSKN